MPMYEYKCKKCGEEFEAMQKHSDAPLTDCRSCDGTVEKLISKSSFQLKGSGWYADGYSGKSNDSGKAEAKPAGGGDKKGGCSGCPSC